MIRWLRVECAIPRWVLLCLWFSLFTSVCQWIFGVPG